MRNRINVRTASEVAEHNLMSLIYQINTGQKYNKPPKPDRFSFAGGAKDESDKATLEEVAEEDETIEETTEVTNDVENLTIGENKKKRPTLMELSKPKSNVTVKFLPLGTMEQLPRKQNLLKSFDLIYLSTSQVSYFTPELTAILKDDSNLLIENIKYVTALTKEQEQGYFPKIKEMATRAKCELIGSNDVLNNNFHLSFHRVD